MIKLIATGYSNVASCEEIFLDDCFNVIERNPVEGIKEASFVVAKEYGNCFVSEESDKYARVHEIRSGKVINTFNIDTLGIVCLSFFKKSDIIISGSYTLGDIMFGNTRIFKSERVHGIVLDESEKFLYWADIKADKIFVYDLLNRALAHEIILPKGAGPRHLKFYKSFLYLVTEYSNEIYVFSSNRINGELELVAKYPTIYEEFSGQNYAATLDINANVLAISNRGKNSISFFTVCDDGRLEYQKEMNCFGNWPRDIKFYKGFLIVANERSDEICVMNVSTGDLVSRIYKKGVNFVCLVKEEF